MRKRPRPKYPAHTRIHPYLHTQIREQLDKWVAAHGGTESAAVERALREMFEGSGDKRSLERRLDGLQRPLAELEPMRMKLEQLRQECRVHGQLLRLFVQLWLVHTPPLPAEQRSARQTGAALGYRRLLASIGKSLLADRTLLDELPEDVRLELRARLLYRDGKSEERAPGPAPRASDWSSEHLSFFTETIHPHQSEAPNGAGVAAPDEDL